MAGPKSKCVYRSEDGNDYRVSLPAWEAALQTCTAPTTQPFLPKGVQRRRRMLQYNDTLKEQAITVLSPAHALWTGAVGTAIAAPESPDFATVPGTANATLQGAIGERRLNRS